MNVLFVGGPPRKQHPGPDVAGGILDRLARAEQRLDAVEARLDAVEQALAARRPARPRKAG
jgi:hypothetical protein